MFEHSVSENLYRSQRANSFSKIFALTVVLLKIVHEIISKHKKIKITLAGQEWIEVNVTLLHYALLPISIQLIVTVLSWVKCSRGSVATRISAQSLNTPIHFTAPNVWFDGVSYYIINWILSVRGCWGVPGVNKRFRLFIRFLFGLSNIVSFAISLSFLAVSIRNENLYSAPKVTFAFLISACIISMLYSFAFFKPYSRDGYSMAIRHVRTFGAAVLLEKLLYSCSYYSRILDITAAGIGRRAPTYIIKGGKIQSFSEYEEEELKHLVKNQLNPGTSPTEFTIYANKKSVICIQEAKTPEQISQVALLTALIRLNTGEHIHSYKLTLGVLSWVFAILDLLNSIFGPGPWPGVDGIDKSVIWMAIVVAIAAQLNSTFSIASCREPFCGNAVPNTDICVWQDNDEVLWTVYSDCEGTIRMSRRSDQLVLKTPANEKNGSIISDLDQLT